MLGYSRTGVLQGYQGRLIKYKKENKRVGWGWARGIATNEVASEGTSFLPWSPSDGQRQGCLQKG